MEAVHKIIIWLFAFILVVSLSATFYKTIIVQDLIVQGTLVESTEQGLFILYYQGNKVFEIQSSSFEVSEASLELREKMLAQGVVPVQNLEQLLLEAYSASLQ